LISNGLSPEQSSGVVGNLYQESNLNPSVIQGGSIAPDNYIPVPEIGFGIAQWSSASRQQGLIELSKKSSLSITDLGLQLNFLWQELNSTYNSALVSLKDETTPDGAAFVFHRDFEGSADTPEDVAKNRGVKALDVFTQYSSVFNTSLASGSSSVCDNSASSYVDGFAIYNQNDPKWNNLPYGESTIGKAGCGPSAMAMIITALTGKNLTPLEAANYGAANGTLSDNGNGGSLWNIAEVLSTNWGLKSSTISLDELTINKSLRSGSLILASGTGASPYTSSGHLLVIRAVTENGKWLIGDSNGQVGTSNSSEEWDPQFILSNTRGAWEITK